MNRRFGKIFFITLCATFAGFIIFGQMGADSQIITNVPADVTGDETRAIVVEDFEKGQIAQGIDQDGWYVTTNPRRYTKATDEETLKKKNPVMTLDLKYVDAGPNDMRVEDDTSVTGLGKTKQKALGLRFRFRYPGLNSISLEPPLEVDWKDRNPVLTYDQAMRKDVQERGIQLPGRAKAISMWVHARGFPYTIEVWIKDYKGDVHILDKQSINFVGWRPLTFQIPGYVPQTADTYPVTRVSKIVRIVIREVTNVGGLHTGTSSRNASDAFVFLDQIKVLTDTYEVYFDGQNLHKLFEGNSQKQE
jgi:hypothetical protein